MTQVTHITPHLRRRRHISDPVPYVCPSLSEDCQRLPEQLECRKHTQVYPSRQMVTQGVTALKEAWNLC